MLRESLTFLSWYPMAKKKTSLKKLLSQVEVVEPVREFLGYLNYSNGKPDTVAHGISMKSLRGWVNKRTPKFCVACC